MIYYCRNEEVAWNAKFHLSYNILLPRRADVWLPSPSPSVCSDGRSYADVITKFSQMDRLPNYFSCGATLARGAALLLALLMLFKGCYRISTVLASLFGWEKTMQIRYVSIPPFFSKTEEKISVFKNIGIRAERASVTHKKTPKHKLTEERFAWFPKTSGFIKMLAFYRTVNTILPQLYFQKVECHWQGESSYRHSKSLGTIRRKNSYP